MPSVRKIRVGDCYEIVITPTEFYANRYGERWRTLTGDQLVLAMFHEIEGLMSFRRSVEEALNSGDGRYKP